MGEPDEVWEERIRELTPYKVTKEVMENAGEKAIFLHCLPAFHDWETKIGKEMGERFNLKEMEVTDEVFESEQSVVFDEAENRMHTNTWSIKFYVKKRRKMDQTAGDLRSLRRCDRDRIRSRDLFAGSYYHAADGTGCRMRKHSQCGTYGALLL